MMTSRSTLEKALCTMESFSMDYLGSLYGKLTENVLEKEFLSSEQLIAVSSKLARNYSAEVFIPASMKLTSRVIA